MEELLIPLLYIAIPAIILMLAFVAFLKKEEKEIDEELRHEQEFLREKEKRREGGQELEEIHEG